MSTFAITAPLSRRTWTAGVSPRHRLAFQANAVSMLGPRRARRQVLGKDCGRRFSTRSWHAGPGPGHPTRVPAPPAAPKREDQPRAADSGCAPGSIPARTGGTVSPAPVHARRQPPRHRADRCGRSRPATDAEAEAGNSIQESQAQSTTPKQLRPAPLHAMCARTNYRDHSHPCKHQASLTVGEITVVDATVSVTRPASAWTVTTDDNPIIMCGS